MDSDTLTFLSKCALSDVVICRYLSLFVQCCYSSSGSGGGVIVTSVPVCVSVCPRAYISGRTVRPRSSANIFFHFTMAGLHLS